MRLKLKRRRGMSNLQEAIICVMLFAVMLLLLMRLMAYSNTWTVRAQNALSEKLDADYMVEMLQQDVKSSTSITVSEGTLQLVSGTEMVIYRVDDDTLYRDGEEVMNNIASLMFVPDGGDAVGVYIRFDDGDLIDTSIHR